MFPYCSTSPFWKWRCNNNLIRGTASVDVSMRFFLPCRFGASHLVLHSNQFPNKCSLHSWMPSLRCFWQPFFRCKLLTSPKFGREKVYICWSFKNFRHFCKIFTNTHNPIRQKKTTSVGEKFRHGFCLHYRHHLYSECVCFNSQSVCLKIWSKSCTMVIESFSLVNHYVQVFQWLGNPLHQLPSIILHH